jgi:hypothetical protein
VDVSSTGLGEPADSGADDAVGEIDHLGAHREVGGGVTGGLERLGHAPDDSCAHPAATFSARPGIL